MPREHVYGGRVTVPVGDPVVPVAQLDLLQDFVTGVRGALNTAPSGGDVARSAERNAERNADVVAALRDRLAQLDNALDLLVAGSDPATTRELVLRATVGWTRDDGQLTLGVTALDAVTRDEVPLDAPHVSLDWPAANRLVRVVRAGRDGACGSPQ